MKPAQLSCAATQLLRALVVRMRLDADRISIGHFRSVDWQSLTFFGERHEISLRIPAPDAGIALASLRDELADAEWDLNGHVVADILIVGEKAADDGSVLVNLEALTLTA